MSGLLLSEGAINAVRDYVVASHPAKIADINARYADAMLIEVPRSYVRGEPGVLSNGDWPICYVITPGFQVRDWRVGYTHAYHKIQLGILVMDTEPDQLQQRSWRHALALYEMVIESVRDGGLGDLFQVVGDAPEVAYSGTFLSDKHYRLEAAVQFTVAAREIGP